MKSFTTYLIAGFPASFFNSIFMKHIFCCIAMLCCTHVHAQVLIQSDDFFKDNNQRFIQTTGQKICNKEGITAAIFYGVTSCSNGDDTLFSLYVTLRTQSLNSIEKGGLVILHFTDGTIDSLPDQQEVKAVAAGQEVSANCYLYRATWQKIMQVNIKTVTVTNSNQEFNIRIPQTYRDVIPGMVRMLYERGRAPYVETL
jgi:hypothetical protein